MNIKKILTVTAAIIAVITVTAKSVDIKTAEKVARNFYFQQTNLYESTIKFDDIVFSDSRIEEINSTNLLYIFDIKDGGLIVISADDAMSPVVALLTNEYDNCDFNNYNPEFQYYMDYYKGMIEDLISKKFPQDAKTAAEWEMLSTDDYMSLLTTKDRIEIGPLLKTVWNQDYPYNYYAPLSMSGPGGRCYAGCVATAMSVLMEYWRWPIHGEGSATLYSSLGGFLTANFDTTYYNYDAMLTSIDQNSEEDAILANALLQYHSGIAVQMDYSPSGSGAHSNNVPYVLKHYFRFAESTEILEKDDYTQEQWNDFLINEISAKHALYYSGCDNNGCHAWNCDGYRNTNGTIYFHHNFNWSGSGNGWYVAANPGGYSSSQDVIINSVPDSVNNVYPLYATGEKILTNKTGRVMDGSGPVHNYIPTEASWLIDPAHLSGDSINNITLSWESFELSQGDYVRVYDGNNSSATLLGEYTGSNLPGTVTSSGKNLYITFSALGSAPGFTFTYSVTKPKYCSGQIQTNESPYYISSSPEGKFYMPKSLCRYTVNYPGMGVKISFDLLDTFNENDYVEIYDMADDTHYGPFYGSQTPEDIVTQGGAYITFKTDQFYSDNYGFALTCSSFDGIEECNESLSEFSVSPNPAMETLLITFNSTTNNDVNCKLLNMQGTVVSEMTFANVIGKTTQSIDVTQLPSGVYLIMLSTDNEHITKKIIIK